MNPLAGIAGLVVLFGVIVQVSDLQLALILPKLILFQFSLHKVEEGHVGVYFRGGRHGF